MSMATQNVTTKVEEIAEPAEEINEEEINEEEEEELPESIEIAVPDNLIDVILEGEGQIAEWDFDCRLEMSMEMAS